MYICAPWIWMSDCFSLAPSPGFNRHYAGEQAKAGQAEVVNKIRQLNSAYVERVVKMSSHGEVLEKSTTSSQKSGRNADKNQQTDAKEKRNKIRGNLVAE